MAAMTAYHRRPPRGWLLALAEKSRQLVVLFFDSLVSTEPTSTAASSTSPAAVASAAAATAEASHLCQTRIDLLLGLLKNIHEITRLLLVISGEQGDGSAVGAGTTSTTNTVDVILRVVGVVVVQDVSDVPNVFT
jgi:hypothetical protein